MSEKRKYYRIRLGRGNIYAEECCKGSFIGADYDIDQDLTDHLPPQYEKFNVQFIPIWLERHPGRAKIAAGLACGSLHTISKGIKVGSIVLCPDGKDSYLVGEVTGDYYYCPDQNLPHRRKVRWLPDNIDQEDISLALQKTLGSRNVTIDINHHTVEIESLLENQIQKTIFSSDETVEDPTVFALEKHLEEFLVENWEHTAIGKSFDIYQEDDLFGQQVKTDTGPIDILARSKDKKVLLVVELKKGRASDSVVGQIQRYMGFVKSEMADPDQTVKGAIIALEDDKRIRRALSVAPDIEFYRYEVSFELFKAN